MGPHISGPRARRILAHHKRWIRSVGVGRDFAPVVAVTTRVCGSSATENFIPSKVGISVPSQKSSNVAVGLPPDREIRASRAVVPRPTNGPRMQGTLRRAGLLIGPCGGMSPQCMERMPRFVVPQDKVVRERRAAAQTLHKTSPHLRPADATCHMFSEHGLCTSRTSFSPLLGDPFYST